MADTDDTIASIVEEIGGALSPLTTALDSPGGFIRLMARLGWNINALIGAVQDLQPLLVQGAESVEESETAEPDVAGSIGKLGQVFSSIRDLGSVPDASLPATIDATAFKNEFPRQIVDYLIVEYLLTRRPRIGRLLQLAGVIRLIPTAATATRLEYERYEVAWGDLANLLSDPLPIFANAYRWGQADFQGLEFLRVVTHLGQAYGLSTELGTMETAAQDAFSQGATVPLPPELKEAIARFQFIQNRHLDPRYEAGIGVLLLPETATTMPGFGVVPYAQGSTSTEFGLTPEATAFVRAEASVMGGIGLTVRPNQPPKLEIGFLGGPTAASAKLTTGLQISKKSGPLVLIGQGGGSRIEALSFSIGGGVRIQTGTTPTAFVEARAKGLALVIKPAPEDSDGFLAKILPTDIRAEFDLTAGIESERGFYFEGSGGLEIRLPVHIAFGPIEIDGALIGVKPVPGAIAIDLAATFKADLSVLKCVVENIGLRLFLKTPPGGGKLGPFDVELGFRPPNGVGMSIDAGVVKGGGYLFFDFDRGEYAGALELTIAEFLSLKAIGLITTKMPDGSTGFSMLIIITAEFSPGIQLGMGFSLIGVGGLLGLNRTVILEALALGVRTGAVNGIMFPVDPVANAPRIISDLRTIFPPYVGRFLIGPMAKIGWGSPALISLALGVIIEIPGNFAILGVLKAILPTEEEAVLKLQVNFVGAIEFDKKRGWFFAGLFESRLVFITIEGELGILIAVGEDANFVLSVGGFHPRFKPPPLPFPSPRRIALDIINTPVARIRAETYFAITTNTVQIGVRAELFFGFDSVALEGHFAFDALLRFSPFYLIVEMTAGASLKAFGVGVFTIELVLTLEGPTPWRARGRGSLKLLFFSVSADFDHTFGESIDTSLPPISIIPILTQEFDKAANWIALPPVASNLLVSLRKLELPTDALVLHPLGTLEVSQNVLPLGITLEKVGAQTPSDANRLVVNVKPGGLAKRRDARKGFAPAQFRNFNDAQKLAAPAFQDEVCGLELGVEGADLRTGHAVRRSLRYEVTTVDTLYRRLVSRFKALSGGMFRHFIKGGAVTKNAFSHAGKKQKQPFDDRIGLTRDRYAVVFTADNRAAAPATASFASESEAREWLNEATAADPNLSDTLHVVPATEMNRAA